MVSIVLQKTWKNSVHCMLIIRASKTKSLKLCTPAPSSLSQLVSGGNQGIGRDTLKLIYQEMADRNTFWRTNYLLQYPPSRDLLDVPDLLVDVWPVRRLVEGVDVVSRNPQCCWIKQRLLYCAMWTMCGSNDTQTNILILTAHPAKRFLTEGSTGEEEPEGKVK